MIDPICAVCQTPLKYAVYYTKNDEKIGICENSACNALAWSIFDIPRDRMRGIDTDARIEAGRDAALSKCGPLGWYPINKALDLSTIPTEIKDNEVKP